MGSLDHATVTDRREVPDEREFAAMLRLLDDDTPEVRHAVLQRISRLDGDVSEWLNECDIELSESSERLLMDALAPGRRRRLQEEWQWPVGGAGALAEDWDHFECLLRLLSDFLHDGVTLRQSLSDAMDLLAEDAREAGVVSPDDLRVFLFEGGSFAGNECGASDPCNLDLAWVAESGKGDALGLSLLFLLVAQRLGLEVEPVDYPGHFFCRIHEAGRAYLVDCHDHGSLHPLDVLLRGYDLGPAEKRCLATTAGPGTVLLRVMQVLVNRLQHAGRLEDAAMIASLRERM